MNPEQNAAARWPFFYTVFDKCLISKLPYKNTVALRSRVVLACGLLAFASHMPVAIATDQSPDYAPMLSRYLDEADAKNPGLAQASFNLQAEQARLESLRSRYYPSLALSARYSVSEGGRTIDFPAGDLLNPVYQTLNAQAVAMGQPARFPSVQNQSIPLLRPTEQDTRLTLKGPIYSAELNAQVDSQQAFVQAQEAARQNYREELHRDLETAYWQTAQAKAQVEVLQVSLKTLQENERVNEVLYKTGSVTLDAPKRAEAERLDLQVQLQQAQTRLSLAREYFNLLRNAPAQAPVETPDTAAIRARLPAIVQALNPKAAPSGPSSALQQVLNSKSALDAQTRAAQAAYTPTVGYALEGGYQGPDYGTGPHTGFATASVVLNWPLFDGGTRAQDVAQAKAKAQALQAQAELLTRRLQLARTQAQDRLLVALDTIDARQAQQNAAEESLRINTRKRDAGESTQIEFLSAEQAATRARLGLIDAIYQAHIEHAQWQYANRDLPDLAPAMPNGETP